MELQYHVEGIFDASVPVDIKDGALIECDGLYDVFDFFYQGDDEQSDYQSFVSALLTEATKTIGKDESAQYQWRNMRVTAVLTS